MASSESGLPNSWASGSLWEMTKRGQVITFIGAGGKTTCLRAVTREIAATGQRVIATTTTKVFPEDSMKSWQNPNPPPNEQEGACFWYVKDEAKSRKWLGPSVSAVDAAIASSRTQSDVGIIQESEQWSSKARTVPDVHWVIEGDGARGLMLKCWEPHEPQIPQRSDSVVLVLDGGVWGRVLQEQQVHRPDGCRDLIGQLWNADQAWGYFLRSPVFAARYGEMSWVILLNRHGDQVENEDLLEPWQPLLDINHRWADIQWQVKDPKYRPKHLRIAAGDAKEGKLQWFDLW